MTEQFHSVRSGSFPQGSPNNRIPSGSTTSFYVRFKHSNVCVHCVERRTQWPGEGGRVVLISTWKRNKQTHLFANIPIVLWVCEAWEKRPLPMMKAPPRYAFPPAACYCMRYGTLHYNTHQGRGEADKFRLRTHPHIFFLLWCCHPHNALSMRTRGWTYYVCTYNTTHPPLS